MIETKTKKKKKGFICEEDIPFLLQRYTATTIIALLQEVAQFADVKIDWNTLVKKTSTGISNAREYQMLWRHLAYRDALVENLDGTELMDDDSDLEYELDAFPPVNSEASTTEAAACVKVLMASGLSSDSGAANHSTVEAPMTINIPSSQTFRTSSENSQPACSTQGTSITVPVSVHKQPLPTATNAEGLDGNGSANCGLPARKKRKMWTAKEDEELIAAVQKCGEGNWANILKGDFTGDRTASQLSQRWAIIRKRKANLGVVNNAAGSQLSEAQLAARRAVNLALKMPVIDNLSMACSAASTHSTSISRSSVPPAPAEASHASSTPMEAKTSTKIAVSSCSSQSQLQSHQPPHQTAGLLQTGTSSTTPRSRATTKKSSSTPVTSTLSPNPMVQAAAVAAGARIATASTAASLYKAAHSKNAVHIRPGGASLIKTSMAGGTKPLTANHAGPRPSVHYIRTGLASPPPATYSGVMPTVSRSVGNKQPYGNSVRPASPTSQPPIASATSSLKLSAQQTKLASSIGAISCGNAESMRNNATAPMGSGLLSKEEDKSGIEMKVFDSDNVVEERVQYDQAVLSNSEAVSENQTTVVENLRVSPNMEADLDSHTAVVNSETDENQNVSEKMTSSPVTEGCENQSMVIKTGEDQNLIRKQTDVPSMATCGSGDKHTVIGIEVPRDKLTGEKQKEKLG